MHCELVRLFIWAQVDAWMCCAYREWGVASINAYRAYGDPSLIKYAESMWEQGSVYMITPEDAAAGKHPTRNVSIQSTCNGSELSIFVIEI